MKKTFLAAAALLLTFTVNAELKNAKSDLIGKVHTANEKVSSFSCKFSQTKKMAFVEQPTKKEGEFVFSKPDKLSMRYTDGEALIISDNKVTMGRNGKVRKMKTKNKHVEALAATLLACLDGDITKLDGTLTKAEQKGKDILFCIDVSFAVGKGQISKLELVYDSKDLTIKSINMIEADGSNTLYQLQNKTMNQKIDEKVFVLKK